MLKAAVALVVLCCALPGVAETVSQKHAKTLAQQFFNQAYGEVTAPVKFVYNGKKLTTDRLFTPFYVYNHPRGGFVIISAENKTFPILAYSLKSTFDADNLSEGEKGWLKGYAHDIEMIRYDSRVPEEAVAAWTDYPTFVMSVLDAPYEATDPKITYEEAEESLNYILSSPDGPTDGNFSLYYTPAQWKDMIDVELASRQSVALGFVDMRKVLYPGVVHGRKGDYYRVAFDRRNDWNVRLMPAEYMGERQVAVIGAPSYVAPAEEEQPAMAYYDSYAADFRKAAATTEVESDIDVNGTPIVRAAGGGHFDILLPENARLAMIYNLNGSHIGRATYKNTPLAHINIEAQPRGFYFAIIYGESGRPYGIKLYR